MAAIRTGGPTWARDRFDALDRAGVAGDVAIAIVAQWDLETNAGRAEWNFNVGNLKPYGDQPRVQLGAAGAFRAFDALDAGVAAYLALLRSARYAPAWAALQADPTSDAWVRLLGAEGYYEADPDTYAAGWRARRDVLTSS